MKANKLIFILLLFGNVFSCMSDQIIHAYVVVKPNSDEFAINAWRPVIRITYKVTVDKVIAVTAGLVDEYNDCKISDKNNWVCQYTDDLGINKFGFENGKYWKDPSWGGDIKYVSRWEYNVIRCKWYQHYEGKFKGLSTCLQTII